MLLTYYNYHWTDHDDVTDIWTGHEDNYHWTDHDDVTDIL